MIGKTRQRSCVRIEDRIENRIEEVFDPGAGPARGVLSLPLSAGQLKHARLLPPSDLTHWIAHYWMVSWDLRGCEPHVAETLPHPNIQVVFETDGAVVSGVQTRKFSRLLEGRSQVFGVKFRPGGFRPFLHSPVVSIRDCTIPAKRIFGRDVEALEAALLSPGQAEKVAAADAFFRARLPEPDEAIELAAQLVERIFAEPAIKTVNDVVIRSGRGKRSIQRVFRDYVGVSPKWVIRRYRLHEVVEQLNCRARPDWAELALELGYFDQAHLINDFHSMVGYSPTEYERLLAKHT